MRPACSWTESPLKSEEPLLVGVSKMRSSAENVRLMVCQHDAILNWHRVKVTNCPTAVISNLVRQTAFGLGHFAHSRV